MISIWNILLKETVYHSFNTFQYFLKLNLKLSSDTAKHCIFCSSSEEM